MQTVILPVDDGSTLALVGVAADPEQDGHENALIFGPGSDLLQQLLIDGALIGVVGNATYDLLKAVHAQLRKRGILPGAAAPTLDDVRARVTDALTQLGHAGPTFDTITQHVDQGWEATGQVSAQRFTARADPSGQLIHLHVG